MGRAEFDRKQNAVIHFFLLSFFSSLLLFSFKHFIVFLQFLIWRDIHIGKEARKEKNAKYENYDTVPVARALMMVFTAA